MGRTSHSHGRRVLLTASAITAAGMLWTSKSALGQTPPQVLESWENTADGWTVVSQGSPPNFQSDGFSQTTGVTNGQYSWAIGPTATNTSSGPNYGALLASPSTMAFTTDLGNIGTNTV